MATKTPALHISNKSWKRYKRIISTFMDIDAGRQTVIWAKHVNQFLTHAEDFIPKYYYIKIEALLYYNWFRNWPINKSNTTGELDDENCSLMISMNYLRKNGYTDNFGYWDFDWVQDRFVINGKVYRPTGDTQVSQAKEEALVFMILLKRDQDTHIDFIEEDDLQYAFAGSEGVYFQDKEYNYFSGKDAN